MESTTSRASSHVRPPAPVSVMASSIMVVSQKWFPALAPTTSDTMSPFSTAASRRGPALSSLGILWEPPGPMSPCARTLRWALVSHTIAHSLPLPPCASPIATLALMLTRPRIGLRQPTATSRSGKGCIATHRAGMRRLPAMPGLLDALAPNHGIWPVDQPRTSGTPGIVSAFVVSSALAGGRVGDGAGARRRLLDIGSTDEEAVFGRQDRPVF